METITRKDANDASKKRYFTGAPCTNGHVAERMVSNCRCVTCLAEYERQNWDTVLERKRRTREANPQAFRDANKRWREAHPDRQRERVKNWRAENQPACRSHERKRRARVANAEGTHTADDIADITNLQRGRCACCGVSLSRASPQIDHIVPLSRGGGNSRRNLQILCKPCNSSKHAKDPFDFMRERGRLI